MRVAVPLILSCSLLAGCAAAGRSDGSSIRVDAVGDGKVWPELWPDLLDPSARGQQLPDGAFPARAPSREQLAALKQVERAWRERDERFSASRDALAADPLTAFWLARLLVRDLLFATDGAAADASALIGEAPWRRPFDALVAMGAPAVPCIALDLLRSSRADRRDVAARLFAAMGPAALPVWSPVLRVDDARARRAAVRALGRLPEDGEALRLLTRGLTDPDLGVQAESLRALGGQGASGGAMLRQRLAVESDRFLRVAMIEGLGNQRDRAAAEVLVQCLEQAFAERDQDAAFAARNSLMQISGRREPGGLASWQDWLATWRGN